MSENLSDLIDEVIATSAPDAPEETETYDESGADVASEEIQEDTPAAVEDSQPTALDEAYQKALSEVQQSAQALHASRQLAEMESRRPVLLKFEHLDEAGQTAVLGEAERAGVDPQTVLYSFYQQQLADYNRERNSMQGSLEREKINAYATVARFISTNEHVARLPEAERKAFMDGIGDLEAVQAIEELAHVNPTKWAKAVTSIASKEIAALAARTAGKASDAKAQSSMKTAMGATKPAATKVQTTPQDPLSSLLAGPTPSWEKRLKATK